MKKAVERILGVDSHDTLVKVLQSWRLWLLGAVAGALFAWAVYALFPPPYRARAIIVIDHNLEEVWDFAPSDNFYFLARETRKLKNLAWSDETIQRVVDQVEGTDIAGLRDEILMMTQPADGGWYLWAEDRHPERAEEIANAWAYAFRDQIFEGMETSAELEQMREEINQYLLENPGMQAHEVQRLIEQTEPLLAQTKGISPYLDVYVAQSEDLYTGRSVGQPVYLLAGSAAGAFGAALAALLVSRPEKDDD